MKKYLILIFVALAAVFQSCDNNDACGMRSTT